MKNKGCGSRILREGHKTLRGGRIDDYNDIHTFDLQCLCLLFTIKSGCIRLARFFVFVADKNKLEVCLLLERRKQ